MAHQTTPHTESEQNVRTSITDLEADQIEQTAGTDDSGDSALYRNNEGAQTGENRGPQFFRGHDGHPNVEPAVATLEGIVKTRTPVDEQQGITSHSAAEESARQQRVVSDRPDVQAGLNSSEGGDAKREQR